MNPAQAIWKSRAAEVTGFGARWLSGLLFVFMGCLGIFYILMRWERYDLTGFLELVGQHHLVQNPLYLNLIAAVLSCFEILFGMLAVLGRAEMAGVLARWLLGVTFICMGLNKGLDPISFLKLLRQYDIAQTPILLNSIASALPWFETFCGLLLLAGVAVQGTALTLMMMLVSFTALVFHRALVIQSALAIPFCMVKFNCGCGTGTVFICRKLLENVVLILLSGWLLTGRGRQICLRFSLLKPREPVKIQE